LAQASSRVPAAFGFAVVRAVVLMAEGVSTPSTAADCSREPSSEEDEDVQVISTARGLQRCVESLTAYVKKQHKRGEEAVLSVDVEGVDLSRHGKACLLQVTDSDGCVFVIDLVTLSENRDGREGRSGRNRDDVVGPGLKQLLGRADVTKVLHDCRGDCDALYHQFNIRMRGIWDTQVAEFLHSRLTGSTTDHLVGLGRLLESKGLAEEVHKEKEKLRDVYEKDKTIWQRRPLPRSLLAYARRDVMFLDRLRKVQRTALRDALSLTLPSVDTQTVSDIVRCVSEGRAGATIRAHCRCRQCLPEDERRALSLFNAADLRCLVKPWPKVFAAVAQPGSTTQANRPLCWHHYHGGCEKGALCENLHDTVDCMAEAITHSAGIPGLFSKSKDTGIPTDTSEALQVSLAHAKQWFGDKFEHAAAAAWNHGAAASYQHQQALWQHWTAGAYPYNFMMPFAAQAMTHQYKHAGVDPKLAASKSRGNRGKKKA